MTIGSEVNVQRGHLDELHAPSATAPETDRLDPAQIPHACAPETSLTDGAQSAGRLIGLDVARAVAVVGMIAVHRLPMVNSDGVMSAAFLLSSGKSSALFAVLAGVGIALSTGGARRPTGRRWLASMVEVAVRAALIGLLGLALGNIIPIEQGSVILAYYAILFLLAIPLLRLRSASLGVLAICIAIAMPVLSHWLRANSIEPPATRMNLSLQAVLEQPETSLEMLLITGTFPALAWMAYVAAGLAIGRSMIRRRSRMTLLVLLGVGLAVAASAASWFLMVELGGRDKLAIAAAQSMTLEQFTDLLVWGGGGTTPATSLWWLGTIAPHTATPPDLLFTLGIAVAVIGVALILGLVAPGVLRPLAAIGSMPLSLYTAHLLLLVVPFMPEDRWVEFGLHLVLLGTFAMVWRTFFARGPLEWLLGQVARTVGLPIRGRSRLQVQTH